MTATEIETDPYPAGSMVTVVDHDGTNILGPFKVARSHWPATCVELWVPDESGPSIVDGVRCFMLRQDHDRLTRVVRKLQPVAPDIRAQVETILRDNLDPAVDAASWRTVGNADGKVLDDHTIVVDTDDPATLRRIHDQLAATGQLASSNGTTARRTYFHLNAEFAWEAE